jgi:hypothetical protein
LRDGNRTLPEKNPVTQFVEEAFVAAFNETMENGNDLPDVRWARIDYFNVTLLTTKWMVWKYVSSPFLTQRSV